MEKRDLTTGATLWSFSEHISPVYGNDVANAVAVDGTGEYIVGFDSASNNGHFEGRIEKRNLTTGAFITTFGTAGAISEHISSRDDVAYGVAVDSTGIYIVGYDENTAGNIAGWRIEKRDLTTGALITSFGTGGAVSEHISPYRDDAYAVTVDRTGLYVVGKDENSPSYPEWRMEKRNLSTGATI